MSEVQDAVQIIRVAVEGVEIVVKATGATFSAVKKAVAFLAALLMKEKNLGKTNVKKLLQRGGDIQVFQFPTKDLAKVEKMAKKYGILYSVLPDINQKDGMSEILFHSEAVPRVNMMIQKLKEGKITSFEEYLKNGDEAEIEKVIKPLREQMGKTPFKEEKENREDFVSRMNAMHEGKNKDSYEITILKYLVREETDHKLKVKLPFEEEKYIWVSKEKVFQSEDGRSFTVYLDKKKDYNIYARDNQIRGTMSGKKVYEMYYDIKNDKIKEAMGQITKGFSMKKGQAR